MLRIKMAGQHQWPHCLEWCRRQLEIIEASMNEDLSSADSYETVKARLEVVYRELACLDVLGDLGDNESQALQLIREALALLESTVESTGQSSLYRVLLFMMGLLADQDMIYGQNNLSSYSQKSLP